MSEAEKAAELARLRDHLADLESAAASERRRPDAPLYDEREIARVRARVAELEADLGIYRGPGRTREAPLQRTASLIWARAREAGTTGIS